MHEKLTDISTTSLLPGVNSKMDFIYKTHFKLTVQNAFYTTSQIQPFSLHFLRACFTLLTFKEHICHAHTNELNEGLGSKVSCPRTDQLVDGKGYKSNH